MSPQFLYFDLGKVLLEFSMPRTFRQIGEVSGLSAARVEEVADNVAGAQAAGLDAVQYTSTPQLVADLRARGIRFNY